LPDADTVWSVDTREAITNAAGIPHGGESFTRKDFLAEADTDNNGGLTNEELN
jgi:hypothetical protein